MNDKVNYEVLHLSELEEALKNIDEETNPQDAELIKKLIARGGYNYPSKSIIESAEITNNIYKWFLVIVISLLLIINLSGLLLNSVFLALVPIAVQGTVLYMIFTKHKLLRGIIRIWSVLLVVSGVFGLFAAYISPDPVNIYIVVDKAIFLIIGFIYLSLSGKYIQLNEKSSNN